MGRRSRVGGVLGSPPPTETTGEQPPTAGFQSRPPIMEDRVLTGSGGYTHGSWVSLPGLTGAGHGLTGDRVAGVLWSRRRHPPEDRAPYPLTLPISSLSQHLSVSSLCSQLSL
jgi:hypothetical protein